MLRIVLVRPGTTDFDQQGRIKGTLDIPLNEHGRQQAARLAKELADLPLQAVYCAPCQSAFHTAAEIAKATRGTLRHLDGLKNLDHGLWSGLLIADVKHRQPKVYRQGQDRPETICPPQGEAIPQAQERMRTELDAILRRHPDGLVAIVVCEPLASLVESELAGTPLGDLWKAECRCGTWKMLQVEPAVVQ